MTIKAAGSSVDKGESLKDTALTLGAYDPDVIVIRHPQIGAPQLVARVDRRARRERRRRQAPASDAGAARPLHDPARSSAGSTGCTSRSSATSCTRASPARSSRRSRSSASAARSSARRRSSRASSAPRRRTDIDAIRDADVVYVLRMQRERMEEGANYVPSLREYTARWGITPERLRPGQKVMHPGPMNRGVEIDPRVADSRRRARRDAGARRASSCGWRCSTTCSPAARSASRRSPRRRWRDALGEGAGRRRTSSSAARASLDPAEGIDAVLDVRIDDGVDRRGRASGRHERAPRRRRRRGLVLAPAFVDPHVHLRTPGREDEETIATGTAAAAAGGYCAILAMPNTDPVVDSAATLGALVETRAARGARSRSASSPRSRAASRATS